MSKKYGAKRGVGECKMAIVEGSIDKVKQEELRKYIERLMENYLFRAIEEAEQNLAKARDNWEIAKEKIIILGIEQLKGERNE